MSPKSIVQDSAPSIVPGLVARHEAAILEDWVKAQLASSARRSDLINDRDLREQARAFLQALQQAMQDPDFESITGPAWSRAKELLAQLCSERARQGFTATETATFIFSLKETLFSLLSKELEGDTPQLVRELWRTTKLIDALGLHTAEVFATAREKVIQRQASDLLELSTPVVSLWKDILALPLIGTLDSQRTQVVMESLLLRIVETGARIAILDITGVPTVDTLVAQHLLKTVAAARLMGADCIISGIRPQIAQTIVHLGVDLSMVTTKSTLHEAFAVALQRTGQKLSSHQNGAHKPTPAEDPAVPERTPSG